MHGMTRIEISYILDSPKAVAEVFSGSFLDDFKHDLDILQLSINKAAGICHVVPLKDFLHAFQQDAKFNQLYIQLRHTAAIIYCHNPMKHSFCGHV